MLQKKEKRRRFQSSLFSTIFISFFPIVTYSSGQVSVGEKLAQQFAQHTTSNHTSPAAGILTVRQTIYSRKQETRVYIHYFSVKRLKKHLRWTRFWTINSTSYRSRVKGLSANKRNMDGDAPPQTRQKETERQRSGPRSVRGDGERSRGHC